MVETSSLSKKVLQGQPLTGETIIDAHTHVGVSRSYYLPRVTIGDLVSYMDRYGIAMACTFAFAGVGSDFGYGNDEVVEAVRMYPQRFIGYTVLNANYPEECIPELERTERLGLRGIKLISGYQGQPEETERFYPVYEWAQARKKIILSHQWGAPEFLTAIAARYPNVCFHVGHLNPAYAPIVRKYDNVYTTTTFVPWPGAIAEAVQTFGAEKILFGSDFPDLDASLNLGPLLTAKISDEDKRKILGGNMLRILKDYGVA
jgi:predicted TIM-barrel fold metal-dependent hydrolase